MDDKKNSDDQPLIVVKSHTGDPGVTGHRQHLPPIKRTESNATKRWKLIGNRGRLVAPVRPKVGAIDMLMLTRMMKAGVPLLEASKNQKATASKLKGKANLSRFKKAASKVRMGVHTQTVIKRTAAEMIKAKNAAALDMYHHDHHAKGRFIVLPTSVARRVWDGFVSLFVIYLSWKVPFSVCFPAETMEKQLKPFDTFLDIFFWCDIVLNFRSAYIHDGHIVANPRDIAKHYLEGWFWIDIVASIPVELIAQNFDKSNRKMVKLGKVFKLSKLLRFGRIVKYLRRYFKFRHFVSFIMALVFTVHWLACLNFLAESAFNPCREDMVLDGVLGLASLYIDVLNHTLLQMLGITTTKYLGGCEYYYTDAYEQTHGNTTDSLPRHSSGDYEMDYQPPSVMSLLSIIITIWGMVLVARFYGAVVHLMTNSTTSHDAFRKKMDNMEAEMKSMQLSDELVKRVKKYYDYLWLNSRALDGVKLYKDPHLSQTLRNQVALELVNGVVPLKQIPTLANCDDLCLARLIDYMRIHVFMTAEYVAYEGEVGQELYYISKGSVLCKQDSDHDDSGFTLEKGQFFGEISLLLDMERSTSICAVSLTELQVLTKHDMMTVFEDFPEYEGTMYKMAIERLKDQAKDFTKAGHKVPPYIDALLPLMDNKHKHFQRERKIEKEIAAEGDLEAVVNDETKIMTDQQRLELRVKRIETSTQQVLVMLRKSIKHHHVS